MPIKQKRILLLELLSSLPERFGLRLHGYALMGNHYHLQLESREANLSKALHSTFAMVAVAGSLVSTASEARTDQKTAT
jgi:hypothetical protein